MATESPTDLVDFDDVSRTTNMSRRTIYRRIREGTFPEPKRVGGRNLWMRRWIEDWKARTMGEAANDGGAAAPQRVGTM